MNSQSLRFICIVFSLFFLGCPEERIKPEDKNPLQLTVEDVTCTEAFLKLSFTPSELTTSGQNRTVSLKRNDSLIATIIMSNNDSLFVDENLLPNKTYTYTLMHDKFSVSAQATTMDTTSHNFTWETTTFGGNNGSCILYDVAIVNDTLAYAVGDIHTDETDKFDSLGNWVNPYNVAKWDGKKWELQRLLHNCRLYYPNCGDGNGVGNIIYAQATSVFAFSANDVWIAAGGVHHFNGTQWTEEAGILGAGNANKIWGDKTIGLYFFGNNGFIAYRSTSGNWQKIESGTTTSITDIYGVNLSGKEEIYCAVTDFFEQKDKKILKITNGNIVDSISWNSERDVVSVWAQNNFMLYACGDGIFRRVNNSWIEATGLPSIYTNHIRGNSINDIIVCGSFCFLTHFNGKSWNWYPELYSSNGIYSSVAILKNTVIVVGIDGAKAILTVGKKN